MAYDLGDVVPLTIDIRDASGALANAGAVVLTIGLPDGTSVTLTTISTPAITNPTTGRYQANYPPGVAGRFTVSWLATGVNATAYSDTFDVRVAAPAYIISLADAKAQVNIDSTVTTSDEELRPFIEAATLMVERATNEVIVRRSVSETYRLNRPSSRIALRSTPCISLTSVTTIENFFTWDVTKLSLDPNGVITVQIGSWPLWGNLQIAYLAGYQIVPAHYTMAARMIVQELWTSQRGNKGAMRIGGVGGNFDPVAMAATTIPPAARELLGSPVAGIA